MIKKILDKIRTIFNGNKRFHYVLVSIIAVVSILLILALDMKLGKDYTDYFVSTIHFEKPVDISKVKGVVRNHIFSIEQFEKKNDADIRVFFIDPLNTSNRKSLEDDLKTLPGYMSIEYNNIYTVRPHITLNFVIISLFILFLSFYIASLNISKNNLKWGLIFSFVGITFLQFGFMYAVLTVISNYVYINKVLVELFLAILLVVIFINICILWVVSKNLREVKNSKNIIKSIHEFDIANDQDFVFWYFLILISLMGVVVNLEDLKFILSFVWLSLIYQMYLVSTIWVVLFDVWVLFLKNFPIIKDLKWSQMR